jgi:hypothetical protein
MDGFDILLVGFGILGLLLTGVATFGKRPASETASIGTASLGVLCIGLGGTSGMLWLLLAGVALLVGAFGLEWYNRKRSA